jgi:hypothetical protein
VYCRTIASTVRTAVVVAGTVGPITAVAGIVGNGSAGFDAELTLEQRERSRSRGC